MKILVTGGAGFIGSNFIRYFLAEHPAAQVYNLDQLTYAGNLENLAGLDQLSNYHFIRGDIADRSQVEAVFREGLNMVVNFAAESHVDRSIRDPGVFLQTNVAGTQVLLDETVAHLGRQTGPFLFLQVSTDEVYGSLTREAPAFTEESALDPSSPYSASKAAADLLALAYYKTFALPVVITRCSNNYGPYQFPEKLIPLMITNALEEKPLPVYGDGLNVRDWLHVEDHCRALDLVLRSGRPGQVYNIGGYGEKTNLEVVGLILDYLGKPRDLIRYVRDRPGHDRRYAMNPAKITRELGWVPRHGFTEGLRATIDWYVRNPSRWRRIRSGEYRDYYRRMYEER